MSATFTHASITSELATAVIEAAERKASDLGEAVSVALVDDSGVLKAFRRMDGAPLGSVQSAQEKASSAVGFDIDSSAWRSSFVQDDVVHAVAFAHQHGRSFFGGSHPVKAGDAIVAAIGVGGGSTPEVNEEVAQAALSVISSR